MPKKRSFWERFALTQLSGDFSKQEGEPLFMLSETEIIALRKIRINTYYKVGIAGAFGVILLYTPYHIFGESFFPIRDIWIPHL